MPTQYKLTKRGQLTALIAVIGIGVCGFVLSHLRAEKSQTESDLTPAREALPELTVNRKAPGFDLQAGPEEARQDIKSGNIRYFLHGKPDAYHDVFGKILKADYGITLVCGGCTVPRHSRIQADGYNQVIHEYLKKMSKEGGIEEARAKARRQVEQEQEKAKGGAE